MGICHHEQDIGLPSGVFLPLSMQGVMPKVIDYVLCKYKDRIFVQRVTNEFRV
jgi:hypothetical protein